MNNRVLLSLHIGYWLLILTQKLLEALGTGVLGTQTDWFLFFSIVVPVHFLQICCLALFFYANYLVLIPYVLKKRNVVSYLIALVGCTLIFTPLYYLMEQIVYPVIGWKTYTQNLDFIFAFIVTLSANFVNIFLGLLLSYLMDWRSLRAEKELIEKEKLKTELAFLKSQVNPHYLFNTINDIYALTQQQSEEAPEALLKLSELLRYMLRESDDPYVLLSSEINYLENVITLQKIGQKGDAYINFEVKGSLDKQMIAPLILINFVENAFKHGVFNDRKNPIQILIFVDQKTLMLHLRNAINTAKKDKTGGIGLNNVKRRLSLLYPNRHELSIDHQHDFFSVDLKISFYD
ncbi:sensor histidine kinase [Leeuwenhoekiella sp. H156]|uniref:sensor histidine kinase n=1 Tax=Leeuwenhoekiella sp. H156 TaxID=3450128 RepID=UPI003FA44033